MNKMENTEVKYEPTKEELRDSKFKSWYLKLSGDWVFHSIQGEWPYIWIPSTFIRLNGCNLACSFCDTKYTFRRDMKEFYEAKNYTPLEVVDLIEKAREAKNVDKSVPYNIVITGWEPLLQMNAIEELIDVLPWWADIQIETNGTIHPTKKILLHCDIICSPKLKSSWNAPAIRDAMYKKLSDKCTFKFVCSTEEDIEEVMEFMDKFYVNTGQVYIMPEGITMEDNHKSFQRIIKKVLEYWLVVTPRLQNIIWEWSIRGV